jgi:hypothetical protein
LGRGEELQTLLPMMCYIGRLGTRNFGRADDKLDVKSDGPNVVPLYTCSTFTRSTEDTKEKELRIRFDRIVLRNTSR